MQIKKYLSNFYDKIKNNSFVKSVFTLSSGILVSQLITMVSTPIISRIYDETVIGEFSLITSDSSIIRIAVSLGLLSAIMIPDDEKESKAICNLILRTVGILSALLFFIALLIQKTWTAFSLSIPYIEGLTILFEYVLLQTVSDVCYAFVNRQKLYKVLFWNPSLGSGVRAFLLILLGKLGFGIRGYAIGSLVALVVVIIHMLRHCNPFSWKMPCSSKILFTKYKKFPLFQWPSDLLGTVSQQIPVQFLSLYWGNSILGAYSMCLQILGIPAKFFAGPVNRVFYREATERYSRGENIGPFAFSILKTYVRIAIVPISILIIFGGPVFAFVLGEKWRLAGEVASILGVYQLMSFCNSCLSGKFVVIRKQQIILILNLVRLVLFSVLFYVCHQLQIEALLMFAIYSIAGVLFEFADLTVFMVLCHVSMKTFFSFSVFYLILPIIASELIKLLF